VYPVLQTTKALRQAQLTSKELKSGKSSSKKPNPTIPLPTPKSAESPVEKTSDF
jgi:hypothetical protein